jgi:hypothetical protein
MRSSCTLICDRSNPFCKMKEGDPGVTLKNMNDSRICVLVPAVQPLIARASSTPVGGSGNHSSGSGLADEKSLMLSLLRATFYFRSNPLPKTSEST